MKSHVSAHIFGTRWDRAGFIAFYCHLHREPQWNGFYFETRPIALFPRSPAVFRLMQGLIPSFPVTDINRSVEFYQRVLGFELVRITGKDDVTRAFLRAGLLRIVLRSASPESSVNYRQHSLEDRIMLHIPIADVQGLYARIKGRVPMVRDLEPRLFGVFEFTIEDMDGILLTFSELKAD